MNSNDFDDLFKRASEKYPLRTDSADWNKIARALDDDPSLIIPPIGVKEEKRKRRRLIWLFFIFPIALSGYYFWNNGLSNKEKTMAAKSAVLPPLRKEGAQPENKSNNSTPNVSKERAGEQNTNRQAVGKEPAVKQQQHQLIKNIPEVTTAAGKARLHPKTENTNTIADPAIPGAVVKVGKKKHSKGIALYDGKQGYADKNESPQPNNEATSENSNIGNKTKMRLRLEALQPWNASAIFWNDQLLPTTIPGLALSAVNHSADTTLKKAASKTNKHRQSYFYTGVIVAPDFSTIKFQSVKGTGYTAGILLGYTLSSKFALETGIYLDSKKYYTKGEYFSKNNIPYLSYVDLLKVQGSCNMIEVPLNLRYNIHTTVKNNWFVTTGFSTYFMFREGYDYNYLYYGNPREKYYSTNSSSQYWFSILNISAGYEHSIGKIGNLRLEPYVRVPLTGMGSGSLPIMSAGLNIGITHRIK